jgi:hypothetical protein
MARTRKAFDEAILADLRARLAALRALACEDLAQLPAAQTDAAAVLDNAVRFTIFRESHGQGKPKTRADPPANPGAANSTAVRGCRQEESRLAPPTIGSNTFAVCRPAT